MLIILSGLPGTGKTTISKALASKRAAVYVRVDEIEQALSRCGDPAIGVKGYAVAYAIASSNLLLGLEVIADSVNPVEESRTGWRAVATQVNAPFLEIEVVCTDLIEHRRRVETRSADIAGHQPPSWSSVTGKEYAIWATDRVLVDTAKMNVDQAVASIEAHLAAVRKNVASPV